MDLSSIRHAVDRLAPGPRTRLVLTIVAAVLLAGALIGLALRNTTPTATLMLGLVAATPYVLLAAPFGALLMLIARQWIGLAVAVLVVGLCVSTQLWLYTSADPPAHADRLSVLTANLRLGRASPADVVAAVRRHRVDVLMLEELTPVERQRLVDHGLNDLLPYHASEPRGGASGTGLWSRFPIRGVQYPAGFAFAVVTAQVDVPGLAAPVTAVALHLAGPVPDPKEWRHDISRLPSLLHALPAANPVIVGGDFNATPDTSQFRHVVSRGYADAADQAGAGMTRTYPSDKWYPPLIAIDHVLCRGAAVATDVQTIQIAGTDHRALLATVAVARAA
jgi:endonuclease/exonuclease/phosphatase (EEP) superfamily protein YafD